MLYGGAVYNRKGRQAVHVQGDVPLFSGKEGARCGNGVYGGRRGREAQTQTRVLLQRGDEGVRQDRRFGDRGFQASVRLPRCDDQDQDIRRWVPSDGDTEEAAHQGRSAYILRPRIGRYGAGHRNGLHHLAVGSDAYGGHHRQKMHQGDAGPAGGPRFLLAPDVRAHSDDRRHGRGDGGVLRQTAGGGGWNARIRPHIRIHVFRAQSSGGMGKEQGPHTCQADQRGAGHEQMRYAADVPHIPRIDRGCGHAQAPGG